MFQNIDWVWQFPFLGADGEGNLPALVAVLNPERNGEGGEEEGEEGGEDDHHRHRDSECTSLLPVVLDVVVNNGVESTPGHGPEGFLESFIITLQWIVVREGTSLSLLFTFLWAGTEQDRSPACWQLLF